MQRPRATDYAAATFVLAAGAFILLDATTNVASAWTPNLGASCLEIAATIAIVDRIVRHQAERRSKPLAESARRAIGNELGHLVDALEYDVALAHAKDLNEIAPRPTGRPLADVREDATDVVAERRHSTDEVEEARAEALSWTINRALPILDRRLAVDREMLEPSLVALLEEALHMLTRRGPDRGHVSLRAYRLARAVTNAFSFIVFSAQQDPQVAKFVDEYVDAPRQERSELANRL